MDLFRLSILVLPQVGFRDDTSYLAAHYGGGGGGRGRRTPRSIAQTATTHEASTLRDARRDVNLQQDSSSSGSIPSTPAVARPDPNPNPNATSSTRTPRCSRNRTTLSGSAGRNRHSRSGSGGGGADHQIADSGGVAALMRPTLSEQLASIGKAVEDITA